MSSLFERLKSDTPARRPSHCQEYVAEKFEAIKQHLERLLNSRQGSSQSSPALGLRDFNDHALSRGDVLKQIAADIRRTIHLYEPRIKVCAIRCQPDPEVPLQLDFRLECQLQVRNQQQQLQIELLVNGHNRYTKVR
ncbi:Lysozyme [compost metagenome]|uniref:type VI secretion system baseplate subunit TssE n=1 Tax=Pseudomonas TaxID=286 RepID=UPI0003FEBE57|nr:MULTISPECIES: type VI secretion system baseplate subunit TssE [Pseudomonas]MCW2271232.1 type VI secretion system protein [Pseudomonas sp. JUb96]PRA58173.1 type VI secretion system baseplate subunit TssE [Pseudomonas sp. MYb187]